MRRVNLLHAHGSPTQYLYQSSKCRCVACRGQKAAYDAAYSITHREEIDARRAAYRTAHREERAAYSAAYRAAHPEYIRDYHATHREEEAAYRADRRVTHREEIAEQRRNWRYSLLPGEWDDLFAAQGSSCAICGTTEPGGQGKWQTDHDHTTGLTRGILCRGCNVGLGHFDDDPEVLAAAIEYLAVEA